MASTSTTTHRNAAAYHAAGHAFMALYEKVPFSDVSIAACGASLPEDPDLRGPAVGDSVFEEMVSQDPTIPYEASTDVLECALTKKKIMRVRSLVKIALAGVIAEQIFSGQRERSRARSAFRRVALFARVLHPHPILRELYLNSVLAQVANLLRPVEGWPQSPWEQISAIAKALIVHGTLTVAEVRRVIADQSSAAASALVPHLPTSDSSTAEWLESEINAVADPPDTLETFVRHKYGEPDRLFPKEDLKGVHDRLKAGDLTAMIIWVAYFQVMARLSASAAFKKLPDDKKDDQLWDDYFQTGLLEALKEARKLMVTPAFTMKQPEHYTWSAIKHAIARLAWLDRRYAKDHKGYDYVAAKGDPSHLPPVETERKYGLTLEVVEENCVFDFEEEVIGLLKKFNGDENRVAELLGRATHVIRDMRHYLEERTLRQKRTVFKIAPDDTIEPVSLESVPRMEELELEEIKFCCKTELEESIIDLMYEHLNESVVAPTVGLTIVKLKNMLGIIGLAYARRLREQGSAMPVFEEEMRKLQSYRPKPKQANPWPAEKPLPVQAQRESHKARP